MDKFPSISLVALLLLLIIMCSMKMVLPSDDASHSSFTADQQNRYFQSNQELGFRNPIQNNQYPDNNRYPDDHNLDIQSIVEICRNEFDDPRLWQDNNSFMKYCPFDDDDENDEEASDTNSECDYSCRANELAFVGRCNRENKCKCCGVGENRCSTETAIWFLLEDEDGLGDCESDMDDQDLVVDESFSARGINLNWDCDRDCVDNEEATVGLCFNGQCQCCISDGPVTVSFLLPTSTP